MAYDGRLMRRAMARFEDAKARREETLRARERSVCAEIPRIAEINASLRATVSGIVASALRRGTDPRPAMEALREQATIIVAQPFFCALDSHFRTVSLWPVTVKTMARSEAVRFSEAMV